MDIKNDDKNGDEVIELEETDPKVYTYQMARLWDWDSYFNSWSNNERLCKYN